MVSQLCFYFPAHTSTLINLLVISFHNHFPLVVLPTYIHVKPTAKIWQKILELGGNPESSSSLIIRPTLFGERHSPEENASAANIDLGNLSLGKVTHALCKGVITNLHR